MGLINAGRRFLDLVESIVQDPEEDTEAAEHVETVSDPQTLGIHGAMSRADLTRWAQDTFGSAPQPVEPTINQEILGEIEAVMQGLARDESGNPAEVYLRPSDTDDAVSFYGRVPLATKLAKIHALNICRLVAQNALIRHQEGLERGVWLLGSQAFNYNAGASHATFQITFNRVHPREGRDGPDEPE